MTVANMTTDMETGTGTDMVTGTTETTEGTGMIAMAAGTGKGHGHWFSVANLWYEISTRIYITRKYISNTEQISVVIYGFFVQKGGSSI